MTKKILFIILLALFAYLLFFTVTEDKKVDIKNISLPTGYTLDNYKIENISDVSCKKSAECVTPSKYLMRSNCPYVSLCIENKCNVVCPEYKAPNIVGGDKDIYGCIGSAGYSWCEVKNKCLRVWEEKCEVSTSTEVINRLAPQ